MKVVHIAWQYGCCNTGGAAIAATRLHLALLERGVESHYLCLRQCEPGPNVHTLFDYARWFKRLYAWGKIKALWYYLGLPMPGFERAIKAIMPDVVHVHWLNNGGPSFRQIARAKRMVVVNLHDAWILTANSPVPTHDMRFIDGYNRNNSSIVERLLFTRKIKFFRKVRPAIIGPSKWICDIAQKSIVARGCIANEISNIVDKCYYSQMERVDHDKFTIVFGCYGGSKNRGKGFGDLMAAIEHLSREMLRNVEVFVFGESGTPTIRNGVSIRYAGVISDANELRQVYAQGDVFAFPSLSETQGMTKIEALLCGLPVLAFDRTACAEGVVHGRTGWIAKGGDIVEYAHGIEYYYKLFETNEIANVHAQVAKDARIKFRVDAILNEVLSLYASIMDQ